MAVLGRGLNELLSASQQAAKAKGREGQIGQDLIRRSLAAKHGINLEAEPPAPVKKHVDPLRELKSHLGACEEELEHAMDGVQARFMLLDSGQGTLTLSFHNLKELEVILQRLKI